jgi:hypothetical protein
MIRGKNTTTTITLLRDHLTITLVTITGYRKIHLSIEYTTVECSFKK